MVDGALPENAASNDTGESGAPESEESRERKRRRRGGRNRRGGRREDRPEGETGNEGERPHFDAANDGQPVEQTSSEPRERSYRPRVEPLNAAAVPQLVGSYAPSSPAPDSAAGDAGSDDGKSKRFGWWRKVIDS